MPHHRDYRLNSCSWKLANTTTDTENSKEKEEKSGSLFLVVLSDFHVGRDQF